MSDNSSIACTLSPSLSSREAGATAFEMKFLVDEAQALQIEDWGNRHFERDPHGDPGQGGSYRITSLYTDTAALDVHFRTPGYRRTKYRLRRYGDEQLIHLERKVRRGERVAKRRVMIPGDELQMLTLPLALPDWAGNWFHQSLLRKSLLPVCQMVYQRTAFQGTADGSPVRLTLDRKIHGQPVSDWKVETSEPAIPLLTSQVILELKFQNALSTVFKQLIADRQLCPTGFSKYRHCINACRQLLVSAEPRVKYA